MDASQACAAVSELELARARCGALRSRLAASPDLRGQPALGSLLRLVDAELRFLSSLHPAPSLATPLSSNLPHLAALHLLLTHPAVRSPSRLSPFPGVDFACAFRGRPAWALVSASNPARLAWTPRGALRARVTAVLKAARGAPPATRPEKLLLVFSRGVGADIALGLAEEFRTVETDLLAEFIGVSEDEDEEGWVAVSFNTSEEMRSFRAFEIDVVEGAGEVLLPQEAVVAEGSASADEDVPLGLEGAFGAFVGKMWRESRELVNLDTTALVAIVSGISNGGVGKLMAAPEEVTRASIVPDSPSARMMDLPTTRKLAMKNKVVFGTGDHWRSTTLTANMGFVRAVAQSAHVMFGNLIVSNYLIKMLYADLRGYG
ncbi:hypothetical protein HU200_022351 [Digitaria exilis]|uniref:DUF1308 domain-containing protein n=1 Tax=Digitaria exilis TaxID=1010633 RepID=A0A835C2X6_9POAL|nr:hypothetical protein HU200_022351 [Digitaria exilis]